MQHKMITGIDVSKDLLDVYISPLDEAKQFSNNVKGFKSLVNYLSKYGKDNKVILEATGGYEVAAAYYLQEHNIKSHIVNPKNIRNYARAIGVTAKTDKIDAKLITLFAANSDIKLYDLPSKEVRDIKITLTRRQQLVDALSKQQTQRHMLKKNQTGDSKYLIKSSDQLICLLKEQVKEVDKIIINKIKSNKSLSTKYEQISSISGVGNVTAITLLSYLPELGDIDHKQISSLVGLAPMNRDSGKKVGKKYIQGGRKQVRKVLYMAVLSAQKHNNDIKTMFNRLAIEKNKPYKICATAAMRKLLIMANSVVRDNRLWKQNLYS